MTPKVAKGFLALLAVAALGGGLLFSGFDQPSNAAATPFDPRSFARGGALNAWQPLTPGLQSVARGFVNVGSRRLPHLRVDTITGVTKLVDGVRAVVVLDQDINDGQVAEQALDFMAADRRGNVWYLGSYTEGYEGGQFVSARDGWLGGVRGASPGILMPGRPRAGSPPYYENRVPGVESPTGQVVKTRQSTCVPFKCYKRVVVIQEGDEFKYFAPGVGGIRIEPQGSGGKQESEDLVNLRQLDPAALVAIEAEVLKLDRHARTTVSDVFAKSAPAKRRP